MYLSFHWHPSYCFLRKKNWKKATTHCDYKKKNLLQKFWVKSGTNIYLQKNIPEVVHSTVFNLGNQVDCFVEKKNWPYQRESNASLNRSFKSAPRADTLVSHPVPGARRKQVSDTSGKITAPRRSLLLLEES